MKVSETVMTVIVLGAVGLLAFGIASYPKAGVAANETPGSKFQGYASYEIIRDEETGCEYIISTSTNSSPTPRLDSTGAQVCSQKPAK